MDGVSKDSAKDRPVIAVVMAGGAGTRLTPITVQRPKPMVPVANRPMMEHILDLLKRHGIRDVVATVHYLADEIQAYFGDGIDFDVNLEYAVETQPLGTAGSVKNGEPLLQGKTIVLVSGDALTDCDLTAALEFHRARKSMATLVLYRVNDPEDLGLVVTDADDRIVRFLEKPSSSEVFSDTVNTGIYILEPEVLDLIAADEKVDWSQDVFPKMLEANLPLYGYIMDGYWCDVGSLLQYREAQEAMLSRRVDLPLVSEDDPPQANAITIGKNTVVDETASLRPPVLIGANCRIKQGAIVGPYAVIGDNSVVEERASIDRSSCWDNVYIGHCSSVHGAILCSRVVVKRDCILREGCVIADRSKVDAGSHVKSGIRIWPNKVVERGATVSSNLIWETHWRANLFRELGVAGLSNLEITPEAACKLACSFGSVFPTRSRIVTSRDSTRSSRMIKRALIAALLSSGCEVLDLRSMPVPIARHFINASGAHGAISARKLPSNRRVTLIEMMDSQGTYISRNLERKIEGLYYREDYRRVDADDVGQIEYASRAIERYQADFFNRLVPQPFLGKPMRIVCDYGCTALAATYPAMLSKLGVESMSLNAFDDAKKSPRTVQEIEAHLIQLGQIVKSTGFEMGALFLSDGERLVLVDGDGNRILGYSLLAAMGHLLLRQKEDAAIAMDITAPRKLESGLAKRGATVIQAKSDPRSLMETAYDSGVDMAGDGNGGFIFPEMQHSFDAPFALGKLITMLRHESMTINDVLDAVPKFHMGYQQVQVHWDSKGTVMRKLSEESTTYDKVEMVDGIKIFEHDAWALILPDSIEPVFHVYTEAENDVDCDALAGRFAERISHFQQHFPSD